MVLSMRRASSIALVSASLLFGLAACTSMFLPRPSPVRVDSEGQNWTWEQRQKWYIGSQGSRLIPERWFRSLVEHASDVTLVLDGKGVITYATPALRPVLGRDPTVAVGRPVAELLHPVHSGRARKLCEGSRWGPGPAAAPRVRPP